MLTVSLYCSTVLQCVCLLFQCFQWFAFILMVLHAFSLFSFAFQWSFIVSLLFQLFSLLLQKLLMAATFLQCISFAFQWICMFFNVFQCCSIIFDGLACFFHGFHFNTSKLNPVESMGNPPAHTSPDTTHHTPHTTQSTLMIGATDVLER